MQDYVKLPSCESDLNMFCLPALHVIIVLFFFFSLCMSSEKLRFGT